MPKGALRRALPWYGTLLALLAVVGPVAATEGHQWQPFQWVRGSITGGPPERLGMLLPVRVNGVACTVQLDTGANGDWTWKAGGTSADADAPRAHIELGPLRRAIPASAANLAAIKGAHCGSDPIAIVGNALFENGTLTLDLGRERYAYAPRALLAQSPAAQPLVYLRWAEGGGHVLVEATPMSGGAGARGDYVMLDTGASRFGVVVEGDDALRALAGNAAIAFDGPAAMRFPGPAGEPVVCAEAPAAVPLQVGGKTLQVTPGQCRGHSFKAPVRMLGVLGMAPLGSRTIVLDYLSRRWTLSD